MSTTFDATYYNIPRSENSFLNRSNISLHFRAEFPVSDPKAILFWIHGYTGHVNGPTVAEFISIMIKLGYALFLIDLPVSYPELRFLYLIEMISEFIGAWL